MVFLILSFWLRVDAWRASGFFPLKVQIWEQSNLIKLANIEIAAENRFSRDESRTLVFL